MALGKGARDLLVLVLSFAIVLGGLSLYTRNWPPAVIVESGSMMHADADVSYGRFGTIDPGDLVLVKRVESIDDVSTMVEGGRDRYGAPGDVIVYYRGNDRASTPIIHRAIAYIEVEGGAAYVRWSADAACEGGASKVERAGRTWCAYPSGSVTIPSVPVNAYTPRASGFLTKGDNPSTNRQIDQITLPGVTRPVPLEWIEGESRAELPWLGLIKLALAGRPNEESPPPAWTKIGSAYAPKDLWVMLSITFFLVIVVPLLLDAHRAIRARRARREEGS